MRLRYLRIRNKPPHKDTKVTFGKEDLLGLEGNLHFLVGINGTGKSRLLQTLVETFLCLESGRIPSFSVTLAYDLPRPGEKKARTLVFYTHESEAHFFECETVIPDETNWDQLENQNGKLETQMLGAANDFLATSKNFPSMEIFLPQALLVYTSGATGDWERLFAPPMLDQDLYTNLVKEATTDQERPEVTESSPELFTNALSMAVWVRGEDYRVALLAAVLEQAAKEFANELSTPEKQESFLEKRKHYRRTGRVLPERYDSSFRSILDEVDWLYPITVSLTTTQTDEPDWQSFAAVNTPTPPKELPKTLHFDLRRKVLDGSPELEESVALRLLRALGSTTRGEPTNPFAAVRKLLSLQRRGVFQTKNIRITLKKLDLEDPIPLESLSDGERMFLGRTGLMQLIGDTINALVILDEPETHFNDYWKREMVDIIDRTLEKQNTDVVLTTHSSIALTDAFSQEINRLFRPKRNPSNIKADHPKDPTFGATPTEVLQEIFEGPRAVGQRAVEFLDILLVIISYPQEVLATWQNDNVPTEVLKEAVYENLLPEEEVSWSEDESRQAHEQLDKRLRLMLAKLSQYGHDKNYPLEQRLLRILKDDLMPKIGAGYYRFEFARRLNTLTTPSA
jgi:ABC-type cobalamin/Fe3+-siderophores transport system ATPase subunit